MENPMQYKHKVAIAYIFAYFLDLMNSYIATVAFPSIGTELHASAAQLSWVITAYILSLTLIIPVSGWLADKYGSKKLFVTSIFIFTAASFFCGFSGSIHALVFWRFVQGLGGGLLIPVGQAMLFRQFPPSERAKISAAVLIPAVIAPMIGPTIGGLIAEHLHWSYIFYFNIPFGVAIFLSSIFLLKEEKQETHAKIDFIGLGLLSLALFLMLYGCYLLSSPAGLLSGCISFISALVVFGIFLYASSKMKHPILELSLLKIKTFGAGTFIYFILGASFSAVNILMIYFFQNVLGASPAKTGLLMIPFGIGSIIGLKTSGHLFNRMGAKLIINISLFLFMLLPIVFCFINNISQYNIVWGTFLIYGLSVGLLANSTQNMSYSHITKNKMSNASAIFNLNRQLGLSLGVGLFTMLFSLLLEEKNILNPDAMHHNPAAMSVFHICFFAASSLNLLSLFVLWRSTKCDYQKNKELIK